MKEHDSLSEQGILAVALKISKPALRLLQFMVLNRKAYGWWVTLNSCKTASKVNMRSKAFKELESHFIVKRGPIKHTYMISPLLLIPDGEQLPKLLEEWSILKPVGIEE